MTPPGSRCRISADRFGRDLARASRREHEPERVGAERDGQQRVLLVGDAADLDPHPRPRVPDSFPSPAYIAARAARGWRPRGARTIRGVRDWLPIAVDPGRVPRVARSWRRRSTPVAHVQPQLGFDEWVFGGTAPTVRLQDASVAPGRSPLVRLPRLARVPEPLRRDARGRDRAVGARLPACSGASGRCSSPSPSPDSSPT